MRRTQSRHLLHMLHGVQWEPIVLYIQHIPKPKQSGCKSWINQFCSNSFFPIPQSFHDSIISIICMQFRYQCYNLVQSSRHFRIIFCNYTFSYLYIAFAVLSSDIIRNEPLYIFNNSVWPAFFKNIFPVLVFCMTHICFAAKQLIHFLIIRSCLFQIRIFGCQTS